MDYDREFLVALDQNKKDMKSLREAVDELRKDLETLTTAVQGVDAVVFTHGATADRGGYERVDYGVVVNVLQALGDRRPRIALMNPINVTTTITGPTQT